jgi:spermidine synthase
MFQDGWFHEKSPMWPGQALSLKVKQVLYHEKSAYQDICVFESESMGRVLALDGVIQVTDHDEFAYQEMIAHLPLCGKKTESKQVCIIGGGDGGVVREVLRHPSVEQVHLCEIDQAVIDISKEYFPRVARELNNAKLQIHLMDGAQFLREHRNVFDVIIVDSSDPVGPAESLFREEFYKTAHDALREDGVLCTQAESIWLHLDLIVQMSQFIANIFKKCEYAYTMIPTYPSGMIGFFLCSKNPLGCKHAHRALPSHVSCTYYTPEIHAASFVLPRFAAEKICMK